MKQKQFNFKQARWALKFVVYDFEIFHQTNKINFVDDFFKRSNYEKISKWNTKFLFILQNKLTLISKISITFNERKKLKNILNIVFLNVTKNKTLSQNKRKILKYLNSMFQLIKM